VSRDTTPLSDDLVRHPVRRPKALAAGLTPAELRGPHWERPLRGVYRWGGSSGRDVAGRIEEIAAVLPDGAAIGGWASLWRHGATDLDGRADLRVERIAALPRSRAKPPKARSTLAGLAPILVCIGPGARIRPRPGIDISRRRLPDEDVVEIDGIPFVIPARSAVDLIGRQPPEQGLASLDATIRSRATSAQAVLRYVEEHPGLRGAPRIRRVADLADGRAKSRPESVMRWVWVVEAGLPRPLVNPALCDSWGLPLGEPDLLDVEAGLVGEYDGSDHRRLARHTADNAREEDFENRGLEVVRATSIDLWQRRQQYVARVRAKHRRGMARDRAGDAWFVRRAG
jgi:hypothetical protein